MQQLIRTILWQRLDHPGTEYFGLWRQDTGWQLRGTVLTSIDGVPAKLRYGVICDHQWMARAVHIGLRAAGPEQALHVKIDDNNCWSTRNQELETLSGSRDVILAISPGTCTLPIRRLGLNVGASAELTAAQVAFPSLTLRPISCRLSRLADRQYCLERPGSGAAWELSVDDLGLVTNVTGIWSQVASSEAHLDF